MSSQAVVDIEEDGQLQNMDMMVIQEQKQILQSQIEANIKCNKGRKFFQKCIYRYMIY